MVRVMLFQIIEIKVQMILEGIFDNFPMTIRIRIDNKTSDIFPRVL